MNEHCYEQLAGLLCYSLSALDSYNGEITGLGPFGA
jgi:hypothetical protein